MEEPIYHRHYCQHGGFLIAGAINKYVYITIHPRFVDGFLLKYSQLEEARVVDEIRHPIIREAIRLVEVEARNWRLPAWRTFPQGPDRVVRQLHDGLA